MLINKLKLPGNIEHFERMRRFGCFNLILDEVGSSLKDLMILLDDETNQFASFITAELWYQGRCISILRFYPNMEHPLDDSWKLRDVLSVIYEMAR